MAIKLDGPGNLTKFARTLLHAGALLCVASATLAAGPGQVALIDAPPVITVRQSRPCDLVIKIAAADSSQILHLAASGLPPGLHAVVGDQTAGRVQLRVYGIVREDTSADSSYPITWSASNGVATNFAHSQLRVQREEQTEGFEDSVETFVTMRYSHGMPAEEAHQFGSRALPLLARMLRDDGHRRNWNQIVATIGFIGDTSSFDTLRAFIWNRFQGPIDFPTLVAMWMAQVSMGAVATTSPRALDYLVNHLSADSWQSIPWNVSEYTLEDICERMSKETIIALAYTDSETAGEALRSFVQSKDPAFLQGALRVHARVRASGFPHVWAHSGIH